MAREIEGDEALKHDRPARKRRREKDQQTRRRAAIRHHVQHGAEAGRLAEVAGGVAVQGVEETGHAVEDCAGARVERHVVEGAQGEDDAHVAWMELLVSVCAA